MSSSIVSVVIPTYNRGHSVCEAVASALAQTVSPFEVIVADDGSTDDTRDRLRPYSTRIVYRYQENQGVSAARNLGIKEARGEFIAFLDSDDVWHPRKLELQLRVFKERPELGLLGTEAMKRPEAPYPEIADDVLGRLTLVTWAQLVVRNRLGTSSIMVRSNVLHEAGSFDPVMKGGEERDLWLRIAKLSSVANLDLPLVGWGEFAGGLGLQPEKCQAGMLRTLHKLDEEGAWKGRRWLRRRAYSYSYNSCAYLYSYNKKYLNAISNLLRSFAWYPLPFGRDEAQIRFDRPKRLIVAALRILRLKAHEPERRLPAVSPSAVSLDGVGIPAFLTSSNSDKS
jgi:glycosyltransferase involved in cell wall biosynthesis